MHVRDCSCAPILRFLCGVRWRHNKPPNSDPHFWSIFKHFEEGWRRQLRID